MNHHGWCLVSPKGKLVPQTFALMKDDCWNKSYVYLNDRIPEMDQLWKEWKESQDLAREKGWTMRKVRLEIVEGR